MGTKTTKDQPVRSEADRQLIGPMKLVNVMMMPFALGCLFVFVMNFLISHFYHLNPVMLTLKAGVFAVIALSLYGNFKFWFGLKKRTVAQLKRYTMMSVACLIGVVLDSIYHVVLSLLWVMGAVGS